MTWDFYLLYFLLGSLMGCFAGLLGLGGGLVMVPILHWAFSILFTSSANAMHQAIATSLAVMVITSIVATVSHSKRKSVLWSVFIWMGLGISAGATLGPYISIHFKSRLLEILFGSVEIALALFIFFFKGSPSKKREPSSPLKKRLLYIVFGVVAGLLGSMLGIGGGVLIVPMLIFLGFSTTHAVGTSAACTLLTATFATLFQFFTFPSSSFPNSLGNIFLPAALVLGLASLLFTPLGVKLSHKLPERHLKKIFILVLVCFGILMII